MHGVHVHVHLCVCALMVVWMQTDDCNGVTASVHAEYLSYGNVLCTIIDILYSLNKVLFMHCMHQRLAGRHLGIHCSCCV